MRATVRGLALAVMAAACVAGCACSGGSGSGSYGSEAASAREMADLLDKPQALVPAKQAAAFFESQPAARRQLAVVGDSLRRRVFQQIEQLAADKGVTVLPDPRLDAAMDDLARALREGEIPHIAAVEFLLSHYGVVEPYPLLEVKLVQSAMPASELAEELARTFTVPTSAGRMVLGVGIDRATTDWTVVLAAQPKHLDLAAVPRRIQPGEEIRLAGNLLGRFRDPHAFVTYPDGKAMRYPVLAHQAEFTASVSCDHGVGRYQIEVLGEDQFGPRVLANFPVYCGSSPPTEYAGAAGYIPRPVTTEQAEAALLELVNQDRKNAGQPAVAVDPRLAAVARAHSVDMVENGFFGHVSPNTGTVVDRVKHAGLSPRRLLETLGQGHTVEEVHGGLLRSPAHRAAILDPEVTHVGVGVVVKNPGTPEVNLITTELFRTGGPGG